MNEHWVLDSDRSFDVADCGHGMCKSVLDPDIVLVAERNDGCRRGGKQSGEISCRPERSPIVLQNSKPTEVCFAPSAQDLDSTVVRTVVACQQYPCTEGLAKQ